ncbi:MAG: LPS export ABC transporter periplasmic protein LptC [bacterium]|nr:LPS export ABC transporter periplasmic protein LptC [bacterium]
MNKYKFLIISSIILIIFLLIYNFFLREKKEYIIKVLLPSAEINKFFLTETYKGKKVWEIKADNAKIFKNEARLKNIKIKFFLRKGDFFIILANEGKINTISKNFTISGNVSVTSNKNLELKTDTLSWDSKKKEIYTSSTVSIAQDNFTITGEGLKLLPNNQKTEILHNTKITIK